MNERPNFADKIIVILGDFKVIDRRPAVALVNAFDLRPTAVGPQYFVARAQVLRRRPRAFVGFVTFAAGVAARASTRA